VSLLSKSQLHSLADSGIEAYLDRLTVRIRGDFPVELGALPSEELRSRVRVAFDRFRAQGFQLKEYIHRLIVLELLFGPRFETQLLEEARQFAFPPPDAPCPSEPERFWAIYRASEFLTRTDAPSAPPAADVLEPGES
jgi:hypothetical protein